MVKLHHKKTKQSSNSGHTDFPDGLKMTSFSQADKSAPMLTPDFRLSQMLLISGRLTCYPTADNPTEIGLNSRSCNCGNEVSPVESHS